MFSDSMVTEFSMASVDVVPRLPLDRLYLEVREMCKFDAEQPFTLKWLDDEGDPCAIGSQMELDEAIRLFELNKDLEITLHGTKNF